MLHPDAILSTKSVFPKYRRRKQCASPAGATLGAEPKLFYPNSSAKKNVFQNTGPPEAVLHPDTTLSNKNVFFEISPPEAMR